MFRRLYQAFTHPVAGPVGFALSALLCAALALVAVSASRTEAQLRARIAQLAAQDSRDGAILKAKLAACESALPLSVRRAGPAGQGAASVAARAEQLAAREPQGFDVCARMESADRAVLESLR